MPLAFGDAEGGKLMDVCLRGEEPTRLRLRGVTILLGVAPANRDASTALSVTLLLGLVVRMTKTAPHDTPKTGIVMPQRRHPLRGLEMPCRAPALLRRSRLCVARGFNPVEWYAEEQRLSSGKGYVTRYGTIT